MSGIIPSNDKVPALLERELKNLAKHERMHRRLNGRLNNLRLFSDHTHPSGHHLAKAQEDYREHPLVQLLLKRRDAIENLNRNIAEQERLVERMENHPDADIGDMSMQAQAAKTIIRMREAVNIEMRAMEDTLAKLLKSSDAYLARVHSLTQTLMRLAAAKQSSDEDDILDADLD